MTRRQERPVNYLALGDSISIDTYTGVAGGGAAAQFARLLGAARFQDLTRDGRTTAGVLEALPHVSNTPQVVTLTAGGNDFLEGASRVLQRSLTWDDVSRQPLDSLARIADHLARYGCPVIINTVYDPTDGDDSLLAAFGTPLQAREARVAFNRLNDGIRALARDHSFLLCDLERLFHGHGVQSDTPWLVLQIEPNLAGATAIAAEWHRLYTERRLG